MEREVGGGIGMGNTCKPMAVSFQCMTKSTTNKKKEELTFIVPGLCQALKIILKIIPVSRALRQVPPFPWFTDKETGV